MRGWASKTKHQNELDNEVTMIRVKKGTKARLNFYKPYQKSWEDFLLSLIGS